MSLITCIYFKNKMVKEVKNFCWQVNDKFYTFWLDEENTKALSVPVENILYVEDIL